MFQHIRLQAPIEDGGSIKGRAAAEEPTSGRARSLSLSKKARSCDAFKKRNPVYLPTYLYTERVRMMVNKCSCFAGEVLYLVVLLTLFSAGRSQLEKGPCRPGTFVDPIFDFLPTHCVPCPQGYFSVSYNSPLCSKCPDDLTTFKPGSTKCVPKAQICTLQNALSSRGRVRCSRRGQFIYEGQCHPCPRGTYQPFVALTCCILCGHGKASRYPGAGFPHECQPLPCVEDLRIKSSFWSLRLEWDPIGFPNVTYSVKFAKEGSDNYTTVPNIEGTSIVLPRLNPHTKYEIRICVHVGYASKDSKVFYGSTLTLRKKEEDTREQGIIDFYYVPENFSIQWCFPRCVNGTLVLLQRLALGTGGGLTANGNTYGSEGSLDPPQMIYLRPNNHFTLSTGSMPEGFTLHFSCTDMLLIDSILDVMKDCTVRHCMKNDSFVKDLIDITNGDLSESLWRRLCLFTTLLAVRKPVECDQCNQTPSCPAPWGTEPADCPCQFGLYSPAICTNFPTEPWNCTRV